MEDRVKTSVYSIGKITNIATYRRKRSFQRNKIWYITIGVIVAMAVAIYWGDGIIIENLNNQTQNATITMSPH